MGFITDCVLERISFTSVSATFTYDGNGQMVKAVMDGVTTLYVSGNYQIKGGVVTKYYAAGNQVVACRTGSTLSYLLSDHIGSNSMTVSDTGTKTVETRYKAWGEVRYQSGTMATDRTYTGQRSYASDFGLMFYNARWYDSNIGHFAQADNIDIKPGDVQSLDRYAYVLNDPVLRNDPTGHDCHEQIGEGDGGDPGCQEEIAAIEGSVSEPVYLQDDSLINAPASVRIEAAAADMAHNPGAALTAIENLGTGVQAEQAAQNSPIAAEAGAETAATSADETFVDQMEPSEADRYKEYWKQSSEKHAPVRSSPYDVYNRYDEDGNLHQTTTYDEFGRRIYQYDFDDPRQGEHYHTFDSYSNQYPNGIRSDHTFWK